MTGEHVVALAVAREDTVVGALVIPASSPRLQSTSDGEPTVVTPTPDTALLASLTALHAAPTDLPAPLRSSPGKLGNPRRGFPAAVKTGPGCKITVNRAVGRRSTNQRQAYAAQRRQQAELPQAPTTIFSAPPTRPEEPCFLAEQPFTGCAVDLRVHARPSSKTWATVLMLIAVLLTLTTVLISNAAELEPSVRTLGTKDGYLQEQMTTHSEPRKDEHESSRR